MIDTRQEEKKEEEDRQVLADLSQDELSSLKSKIASEAFK